MPVSNRLVDTLPPEERAALSAISQAVSLPLNTPLYRVGEVSPVIYLLTSGVASVVTPMDAGVGVEVALVGREGLTGGHHLLGNQASVTNCSMQVPGTGLRAPYAKFAEAVQRFPVLRTRVLQHAQYENLSMQQLSACNRVHHTEARLARWLLMVADRTGDPKLPLTQGFMSDMLGTRRTTITVIAGALQRSGLIEYRRGHVALVNREGLRQTACECYPVLLRLYQQLYKSPATLGATRG